MHRHVGFVGAMHAEHAEPGLAGGRIGAEAHQRRGDREARQFDQLAQEMRGFRTGIDDAAAGIDDRLARIAHQFDRFLDLLQIALLLRLVAFLGRNG
ncbi:hypothetical protein D9M72_628700 [compost metagenome]